jgi:hypothetical protein
MLVHHDSRPYEEAASQAAAIGRQQLLAQIERDRSTAEHVIREIDRQQPQDALVPLHKLKVRADDNRLLLDAIVDEPLTLSKWAAGQLADKVGMPVGYMRELLEEGGEWAQLAAHNLATLAGLVEKRVLVRRVGGEVRGVLSDHFRRIDVRPSIQAFLEEAMKAGAIPLSGLISETRASLRVILPTIYEPVLGEVLAIGAALTNSDVGHGAEEVSLFLDRPTARISPG